MIKKKITALLSLLVLPNACSVLSCTKTSVDRKISTNNNEDDNSKTKNAIKNLRDDEEVKKMKTQLVKINALLNEGIDGSKDFTPSQSLADISVQKRIIENINELCNNPENIKFTPQLKSQYFKAGNENYIDVEIIYTNKYLQISSVHHNFQIKNVKQDLQELVDKALEDLKNPIDFAKSFLIENDDLQYENIENEFIKVLNNQLEQDDERLSIKLLDKTQSLLNNRKIEIEVIGKDDNEEIKKRTQVVPINLLTIDAYIADLKTNISIIRANNLFAYDKVYNPPYKKEKVIAEIRPIFKSLNSKQLQRRQLESFIINNTSDIIFNKTKNTLKKNTLPVLIKLEFNKLVRNINLSLFDIEHHPEFILNEVANHFKTDGLDLTNEPIFADSDFHSDDIKNKIINIMNKSKKTLDEEDEIEINLSFYFYSYYSKMYSVNFSHKNYPKLKNVWEHVILKNIELSPKQDLRNYMENNLNMDKSIKIDSYYFDLLNNDNLREYKELIDHMNVNVRTGILFSSLPDIGRRKVQIAPITMISKDGSSNSKIVEYEFKFEKSGVTASIKRNITFQK